VSRSKRRQTADISALATSGGSVEVSVDTITGVSLTGTVAEDVPNSTRETADRITAKATALTNRYFPCLNITILLKGKR
jgi:hypothetical protein